ncbi:MAG TPA: chromate transporter [Caulobacteraceae bacterium]|jgi:chromate transporter|nr:chromate transporter [Caulobacteraceae bacterium]
MTSRTPPPPTLSALALAFARISVASFGGGVSAWMMRELVHRRRWLTNEAFLADLAMAQALPGVNVVNLPLWIGYRLFGGLGALVCALAVIVPSAAVLAVLAVLVIPLQRFPQTGLAFAGAAAAAIGLSLATGFRAAQGVMARPAAAAVMGATFVAVGLLKLPMVPVLLVLAPASIALAHRGRPRA